MSHDAQEGWTAPRIVRFRQLWDQTDPELSTAEIGRQMGVSKNAVVGKAHRLDFPSRPSPIQFHARYNPARIGRPKRHQPTLPPLASEATPPPVPSKPVRPPTPQLPVYVPPPPARPSQPCCWPLGEPGKPDFRFCEEPGETLGKPYCKDHARQAYVRVRDRREDDVVNNIRAREAA
jgi:GcrA cell cycle regulator